MLKIVTAPNSILSQSAKPVAKIDKSVFNLIKEMKEVLLSAKDPEGVGLAAPQVGKSLRLFITKPTPKSPIQTFINPKILQNKEGQARGDASGGTDEGVRLLDRRGFQRRASSFELERLEGAPLDERAAGPRAKKANSAKLEGCLSLPNIWGEVKRNPSTSISYLDTKGKKHTKTFRGIFATIIQHETDHLNGILFPKRVLEQKGTLYKSHKDEKGEDVFEEIDL